MWRRDGATKIWPQFVVYALLADISPWHIHWIPIIQLELIVVFLN